MRNSVFQPWTTYSMNLFSTQQGKETTTISSAYMKRKSLLVKKSHSSTSALSNGEDTNSDSKIPGQDGGKTTATQQDPPTKSRPKSHSQIGFDFGYPSSMRILPSIEYRFLGSSFFDFMVIMGLVSLVFYSYITLIFC